MNKSGVFILIIYILSVGVLGYFFTTGQISIGGAEKKLEETKSALMSVQHSLDLERTNTAVLTEKITEARNEAKFIVLALCPSLEATDPNALCVKDNTDWFSQTMIAGTTITDSNTKELMDKLLVSLGAKTKPTAKQLYELLKPIEISALKALNENLK